MIDRSLLMRILHNNEQFNIFDSIIPIDKIFLIVYRAFHKIHLSFMFFLQQ